MKWRPFTRSLSIKVFGYCFLTGLWFQKRFLFILGPMAQRLDTTDHKEDMESHLPNRGDAWKWRGLRDFRSGCELGGRAKIPHSCLVEAADTKAIGAASAKAVD